ncbi:DUF998 domain-containing protein [Saccharopolyspora rhizosphaerae]|uniref:DUF998 domain-containing protein n=1 Tax=Saccharopolyspora rhizosphaerae TaxID=2492662 RepID=A0A3R8VL92_9PSEU|nr:DUF998 domain-containing protein [Saccharopolyspora rhizosphaerae]RRO19892.1 DUF998 domain-containing protein [Saccharopolyspora rhizosphaerae]
MLQARDERTLLRCGTAGAVLFVAASLVIGSLRSGHDPLSHPVSSLATGALGWAQAVNSGTSGVLIASFAFGVRCALLRLGGGWWVPGLVIAVGIGLIGAGFSPPDPSGGASVVTAGGILHQVFSVVVQLGLPAASWVLGRLLWATEEPWWAAYCYATTAVAVACLALASLGFLGWSDLEPYAGLYQRTALGAGFGWLLVISLFLRSARFSRAFQVRVRTA